MRVGRSVFTVIALLTVTAIMRGAAQKDNTVADESHRREGCKYADYEKSKVTVYCARGVPCVLHPEDFTLCRCDTEQSEETNPYQACTVDRTNAFHFHD